MSWSASRGSVFAARDVSAAYCRLAPGHPWHGPYHESEYGFPAEDEAVLFERLVLEIKQAGVFWPTGLHQRPAVRAALPRYEAGRVARLRAGRDTRRAAGPGVRGNTFTG